MRFERILVVCTANVCRSPYVASRLAQALPDRTIVSAGTQAVSGDKADSRVIERAQKHGISLLDHRSMRVNTDMLHRSDVILVMEETQAHELSALSPVSQGRIQRVGMWNNSPNIDDPHGDDSAAYDMFFTVVEVSIEMWIDRLNVG